MKRVYKDERGSSLVMTIIAMTFISILAVAVIAMTITNIRLKQAQKESQKNFYNADSIVDAIRAGIYDVAAEAAEKSYEDAIVLYGSSSTSMKQVYSKNFMTNMVNILSNGVSTYDPSDDSATYYYSDTVIRRFLTDAQGGAVLSDGYRSAVSDKAGCGYLEIDLDSLILKDVAVVKTDNDYKTTIKTDIRVNVPNITEETDSEYLAFALLADNQILSENPVSNTVNGSVYAGISKSNINNASRPESGLIVSSGSTLTLKSDFVITRGDIRMDGNGTLDITTGADKESGVYAENIETKQEKVEAVNNLKISGNTYIADDMELWGDGDKVVIEGNYYGYNYNDTYASPTVTASKQSEFSSAILINGRKTSLDMTGVKNMMLAGYTFISRGLNNYGDPSKDENFTGTKFEKGTGGATNYQNQDIAMGESMTVKSSQLAYYVPRDYVQDGETTGAGLMPFTIQNETSDKYTFNAAGYTNYLNCSDASFDITNYVDAATPLTCYYRNDVNVKGDLQYFYLNFKSDAMAKKFYEMYQKCDPYSEVEDVNKAMLSDYGIQLSVNDDGTEKDGAVLTRTGTILYGNNKSTSGKANQYLLKPNQDITDVYLYNDAKDISKRYMSYQMSLLKNYDLAISSSQFRLDLRSPAQVVSGLADDVKDATRRATFTKCGDAFEDTTSATNPIPNDPDSVFKTNLFSTLVDEKELDAYTGPRYQELTVKMKDGSERKAFVVIATGKAADNPKDYTWDGSDASDPSIDSGLILARGNVTLSAPFKGLVIAGEDIIFSGGSSGSVSADRKLLQTMFDADKGLGTASKFYHMFSKYFQTTITASISNGKQSKDTVEYENWKKNKETD